MQAPQDQILMELYQRLEFKSWQDEIRRRSGAAASSPKRQAKAGSPAADDLFSEPAASAEQLPAASEVTPAESEYKAEFHTILTEELFADWLARLSQATLFAFDTETTSVDAQQARLVGISFAVAEGEAAYVPLAHSYMGVPQQLDEKKCWMRYDHCSKIQRLVKSVKMVNTILTCWRAMALPYRAYASIPCSNPMC